MVAYFENDIVDYVGEAKYGRFDHKQVQYLNMADLNAIELKWDEIRPKSNMYEFKWSSSSNVGNEKYLFFLWKRRFCFKCEACLENANGNLTSFVQETFFPQIPLNLDGQVLSMLNWQPLTKKCQRQIAWKLAKQFPSNHSLTVKHFHE